MGLIAGTLKGNDRVKVIKGKPRKEVIEKIKNDVFKLKWDTQNYINTIKLIQSLDKKEK